MAGNIWETMYEQQSFQSSSRPPWIEYTTNFSNAFSPQTVLGQNWSSEQGVGKSYGSGGSISNLLSNGGNFYIFIGGSFSNGLSSASGLFSSFWNRYSLASRDGGVGVRCMAPVDATLTTQVQTTGTTPSFLGLLATGQTTTYSANDDGTYQSGTTRSFTNNGDNTVTDNITNLMWEDQSSTASTTYTWANAVSYCDNLTLGGYSDWVLPNDGQLKSIVNYGIYNPSIFSGFINTRNLYYWSNTNYAWDSSKAWSVRFSIGDVDRKSKDENLYVRCVRGGL